MKLYILLTTIILTTLFSCSKDEGEGGRSSVSGKIHMTDITGGNQGEYDAPDYDVYILYGDKDDVYDDDMKTNYDGTFKFSNLRKGFYRIYTYTVDNSSPSGVKTRCKSIDIGGNEDGDVGTIEVEK